MESPLLSKGPSLMFKMCNGYIPIRKSSMGTCSAYSYDKVNRKHKQICQTLSALPFIHEAKLAENDTTCFNVPGLAPKVDNKSKPVGGVVQPMKERGVASKYGPKGECHAVQAMTMKRRAMSVKHGPREVCAPSTSKAGTALTSIPSVSPHSRLELTACFPSSWIRHDNDKCYVTERIIWV